MAGRIPGVPLYITRHHGRPITKQLGNLRSKFSSIEILLHTQPSRIAVAKNSGVVRLVIIGSKSKGDE
jgi:hypothetical protein